MSSILDQLRDQEAKARKALDEIKARQRQEERKLLVKTWYAFGKIAYEHDLLDLSPEAWHAVCAALTTFRRQPASTDIAATLTHAFGMAPALPPMAASDNGAAPGPALRPWEMGPGLASARRENDARERPH